jgi:hypothetical protein
MLPRLTTLDGKLRPMTNGLTIMQNIELDELMGMLHAHRMQWIELTRDEIANTVAELLN